MKRNLGITLVALVVTIVILIILATISINIVFNEDGMVKQAEKAKEHQANAEAHDIEKMQIMDNTIKEYINGKTGNEEIKQPHIDNELINPPKLADGMIPVKWNGTGWVKTKVDDSSWYNYANKEWANIVLSDSTFNGDILDETKPYSQLVWIPRFAYKITSGWHSTTTGTIEVVFVGTDNKGKDGTVYNGTYSDATNGITSGGAMKHHVVNPAFNYGETKLEGFWIGKYESSHTGCTTDKTTGEVTFTGNEVMQIKPNVTSWRMITIGDAFDVCLNMNKASNPYGLSNDDSVVDPHMVKNTEWGAIAYLSKSKYGKETEEVYINNSSDFITGNAGITADATETAGVTNAYNTAVGQKASTTGNIYGVYDMSGGSWDYVAAYISNDNENLTKNGNSLLTGENRYKEVYEVGTTDTKEFNYAKAAMKYGDAVYETSNGYEITNGSWYNDWSNFMMTMYPFFYRGSACNYSASSGIFASSSYTGETVIDDAMRVTIPVLK